MIEEVIWVTNFNLVLHISFLANLSKYNPYSNYNIHLKIVYLLFNIEWKLNIIYFEFNLKKNLIFTIIPSSKFQKYAFNNIKNNFMTCFGAMEKCDKLLNWNKIQCLWIHFSIVYKKQQRLLKKLKIWN